MNDVLQRWNRLRAEEAALEVLACCGSSAWAKELSTRRPIDDEASLLAASDEIWSRMSARDWSEAFAHHPRIGERKAPQIAAAQSAKWSEQEQHDVASASETVQSDLAEANREYERRFGRVFIVCATGKSADEMLDALRLRLHNDDATELLTAAEEQRKITNIRLKKWLGI